MTKLLRAFNVITGIGMFVVGALFFVDSPADVMEFVLFVIQLGMTLRGLRTLYYYLTMARYMVGGKQVLYRSMIYLDLGILAGSVSEHPVVFAVLYMAAIHAFEGLISILRANESRKIKAHWKFKMSTGLIEVILAIDTAILAIGYGKPDAAIYLYGVSLIYLSVLRIVQAFRHTEIVYIQ